MYVKIVEDKQSGAEMIVHEIIDLVKTKADANIGLATGGSMEPVYEELISRCRKSDLNFDHARWFLLDEYLGLEVNDPARYRSVITRELLEPLGLDGERLFSPDTDVAELDEAGQKYEAAIRDAGGIDLQLLGIGRDGHIGFNEPGSSLASRTRVKRLRTETRKDNARFFGDDESAVPTRAITQGIGTISDARRLILVAWGASKADAIAKCVEGPVTAMSPASALQFHPEVTIVVDEAAAAGLHLKEYYSLA
jgi:glucosamine-6-phosphate deaminase